MRLSLNPYSAPSFFNDEKTLSRGQILFFPLPGPVFPIALDAGQLGSLFFYGPTAAGETAAFSR